MNKRWQKTPRRGRSLLYKKRTVPRGRKRGRVGRWGGVESRENGGGGRPVGLGMTKLVNCGKQKAKVRKRPGNRYMPWSPPWRRSCADVGGGKLGGFQRREDGKGGKTRKGGRAVRFLPRFLLMRRRAHPTYKVVQL